MSKISNKYSINELDLQEAIAVKDQLISLDKNIDRKILKVMNTTGCSFVDALEYVVTNSPALWAKVYLNWEARDYQMPILDEGKKSKQLVLRLGRRLGKTDSMCILILWYAYTQINKGTNGQYNVLILTPYETQIDLIFTRLDQLIEASPFLQEVMTREVYHRKEMSNGSIITGLTAGASAGNSGSNNTRGQTADLIVLDEVDYIGSNQISNIMNIRNEAPGRIRIMAASTPCGKHEEFYKWCVGSSKSYKPDPTDIKNLEFHGYQVSTSLEKTGEKGNGWTEIYAPSIVNKELLEINPITEQSYLQDIKDELSELRYDQEVMAEFGDQETGVYKKIYIQEAIDAGIAAKHRYVDINNNDEIEALLRNRTGPIVLGVDWDKVQAGTTMVGMMLDKYFINAQGNPEPKYRVIFRVEIPRTQFTYTNAVNKIIELNDVFDFDWIAVDRGYGETQIELLHSYGMSNPSSGLQDKVIGYQFGEKIEVRDPHTRKIDKKPLKPFMVNNSVNVFEKKKIVFDPTDKYMIEQFEAYVIKSTSVTGLPTYTDENEHSVDAVNLCLLIIEQKYGALFRSIISSKILPLDGIRRPKEPIDPRVASEDDAPKHSLVGVIGAKVGNSGFVSNRGSVIGSTGMTFGGGRSLGGKTFTRGRF
jgi:hypothetical protein